MGKQCVINIKDAWIQEADKNWFRYPVPEVAKGFYFQGFCRRNDSSMDFMGWYGLALTVQSGSARQTDCTVTVTLCEGEPLHRTMALLLDAGKNLVEIPFSEFPVETVAEDRWQFVNGIEISFGKRDGTEDEPVSLTGLYAVRDKGIFVEMPVKGKSQKAGGSVLYEGMIYNCTDKDMAMELQQVFEGWESMMAELDADNRRGTGDTVYGHVGAASEGSGEMQAGSRPQEIEDGLLEEGRCCAGIVIQPYGAVRFTVRLVIHDNMVPGGHENTRIRVTGRNRYGTFSREFVLKTMCALPHPYIYHDKAGWQKVMDKIRAYPIYEKPYQEYIDTAEKWEVHATAAGRDYCYETREETNIMSTAYAYTFTGDEKYAQKLVLFFRYFTDEVTGYPARLKGCSQSYVQEGHFFQHLAIPYDIIHDSGCLSQADREAVEKTFRLYMKQLDKHIRSGKISNWLISEIVGAFYCALSIQDMDRVLRFLFGNGGLIEQFRHGVFNDGWWHECSVGYNTWVSSMMMHAAHAMLPFGYDLVHTRFQIPYNQEVSSTYADNAPKILSGMYNQKWGGNTKNYVCIKDMFDAVPVFLDYRGVLFGIADSDEKKLSGVHFGSTYDLAYTYYRDPRYIPVIKQSRPDPIFGNPELLETARPADEGKPETAQSADDSGQYCHNAYSDNIGIMMLRSRKEGREPREQIQAVLRYGSHGGAHGHFDTADLLSVMRYGRSFFNPENCWWGYAHFMYKFYVQCSLTKNMVVVDDKMQVPADSRRILFCGRNLCGHATGNAGGSEYVQVSDGEVWSTTGDAADAGHSGHLQAAGVEVRTKWAYPPYGGMVYYQDGQTNTKEELRKRCRMNHCYLPVVTGEDSPVYGEMSGFTEEILQRRVMAVTDDYIVLFDYLQGSEEHIFDSLMQIKGFQEIACDNITHERHTEQFDANPVSDAQFITDCDWYRAEGVTKAHFETIFTEADAGEQQRCDRSNYNEPGPLKMDVYTAWPLRTEQIVGRVAVYDGWAADGTGYTIPLAYRVEGDGRVLAQGAFDGWILGRGEVDVDLTGVRELSLVLKQEDISSENRDFVCTPQGCFWGEAVIVFRDGSSVDIGAWIRENAENAHRADSIQVTFENIDTGCGIGRDYKDGRVTIVGTTYQNAIPASTIEHGREGAVRISLADIPSGQLEGARLRACVGVDAFAGDESQKRKMYAVRTKGTRARFVTVIEPYESGAAVREVIAVDENQVNIVLRDGRVQTVGVSDMECADGEKVDVYMHTGTQRQQSATSKCNHTANR